MSSSPTKQESPLSVIPPTLAIPAPIPLKFEDNQDQTQKANIQLFNTRLAIVHALWDKANSFSKAIALLNEIDKLIKLRCEIMGHSYGVAPRSNAQGGIVYPTD